MAIAASYLCYGLGAGRSPRHGRLSTTRKADCPGMSEITRKSDQQKGAEAEVESFRKHLGSFVVATDTTRMAMLFADTKEADDPIIFANDSFLSLTGYDREEILGNIFNFLIANRSDAEALARIQPEFEGSYSNGTGILCRRKGSSEFWAALFISPVSRCGR
jgi:PAS domain S-box-containing protein